MKRTIATVLLTLMVVAAGSALAGSIKSWSGGDVLTSADLNANFSHIHSTMVGSHGARLVNADVSASAAIAHSKLATPALVPKGMAQDFGPCDGAAAAGTSCSLQASAGNVSDIQSNGAAGQYRLELTSNPTDAYFQVFVQSHTISVFCVVTNVQTSSPHALIKCYLHDNTPTNAEFSVMVMDNN